MVGARGRGGWPRVTWVRAHLPGVDRVAREMGRVA